MYYCGINTCDIANGQGVRVSIFFSGCLYHRCDGCQSPETWSPTYGKPFDDAAVRYILETVKPDYISGITCLGGEPMDSQEDLVVFLREFKKRYPKKDVWCYSGYRFEELIGKEEFVPKHKCPCLKPEYPKTEYTDEILSMIDVLVDGEFELDKRDITLVFRGSSNQRLIDVQKSLQSNRVVLHELT